jgi:hypothetical protein
MVNTYTSQKLCFLQYSVWILLMISLADYISLPLSNINICQPNPCRLRWNFNKTFLWHLIAHNLALYVYVQVLHSMFPGFDLDSILGIPKRFPHVIKYTAAYIHNYILESTYPLLVQRFALDW